ncbi:MAG: glycosyltransferase [Actinomycetota bacterium]|nr:glycosyltransferase [Actinomycetota bacterium]
MAVETRTTRTRRDREQDDANLPRILAIVVTHDGRRWLKDCLVGLNQQTYPFVDVLVVDDASPDVEGATALKRIAKRHLRRRRWGFLRTPRPLGFGGAINWAMSRARVTADLLLFIHDDAELTADSVEKMVGRILADDTTAIVGPKIVAWDDPKHLEEVGMATDRFGYPYKGLEDDEIDSGQHDVSHEVFYVTSTCMLVRHEVFRQLKGWDARMRAFSEDLDLCWRARLLGHSVRVEPLAKARHAIALARGERASRFTPTRYYIRRNRFRAVGKNASAPRLAGLIPQIVLLTVVEMIGFIVLRQPREILNLLRALGWNFINSFQTLGERRRAQRGRIVTDRKLRRLTVRETTRVRAYIGHQADRLEEAWGRGSAALSRRREMLRAINARTAGLTVVVLLGGLVGLLLCFRHFLWAPQVAIGELLPYPERATALLRAWTSPWQTIGLGQPGPAPPSFALLGFVPLITFGVAGAAQKLLVIGLGGVALLGAYHLIGEVADRRARLVAGFTYALGGVGYAALRSGDLSALVFAAAAPFVLHSLIRLTGWVRPAGWNRNKSIARLALGAAISAAFVPGALFLYLLAAVILAVFRLDVGARRGSLTGLGASVVGLAAGWALLLPWSWTWLADGGTLDRSLFGPSSDVIAANYAGHGAVSVVLGQTPDVPALFGLALPILGTIAVVTGEGQRRRLAVAFWGLVAVSGLLVAATTAGIVPPLVSTPTSAAVIAAIAFAGLAGLAAGAFRLDLPRRGLGWIHAGTVLGVSASIFLVGAGFLPAMWAGDWAPGRGLRGNLALASADVRSIFAAEAVQGRQFRALWVGDAWSAGQPTAARPNPDLFVTGSRGQVLTDLFENNRASGDAALGRVVASIQEGTTDRGGGLLGAFNVRFVVLERGPGAFRWLSQRDLALHRDRPEYILLENTNELPRAAVFNELPVYVQALERDDPALTSAGAEIERTGLSQDSPSAYVADDVSGPGVAFLAENVHPGWTASVDGETLERSSSGWGNAFAIPAGTAGRLSLSFPHTTEHIVWLIGIALAWIVVIGASFSRRKTEVEPV